MPGYMQYQRLNHEQIESKENQSTQNISRTGSVAQAVEHLQSMCKASSSNPSTTTNNVANTDSKTRKKSEVIS
jgi:hypothetical protein